jgi:hypothetical protein
MKETEFVGKFRFAIQEDDFWKEVFSLTDDNSTHVTSIMESIVHGLEDMLSSFTKYINDFV